MDPCSLVSKLPREDNAGLAFTWNGWMCSELLIPARLPCSYRVQDPVSRGGDGKDRCAVLASILALRPGCFEPSGCVLFFRTVEVGMQ